MVVSFIASAVLGLAPGPSEGVVTRWTAPASCPDEAALEAEIARQWSDGDAAAGVQVEGVVVERSAGRFELVLTVQTRFGRR